MYHGRFLQGSRVPLSLLTKNSTHVPTAPDDAPVAVISRAGSLIQSIRMPVQDRFAQTGWFQYPLLLGSLFPAGQYRVVYQYVISGTAYGDVGSFEVVGTAGHPDGAGISMIWYARPTSDFVLVQTESGRIIRRRNPRL